MWSVQEGKEGGVEGGSSEAKVTLCVEGGGSREAKITLCVEGGEGDTTYSAAVSISLGKPCQERENRWHGNIKLTTEQATEGD